MLQWIRSLGGPRTGDGVQVTDGPFAGQSGVIQATTDDGRFRVFIDECCQPVLSAGQFRRVRRSRNVAKAARDAKMNDPESLMRQSEITSRDTGGKGF